MINCKLCNSEFSNNVFTKHLLVTHNINSIEDYAKNILRLNNKCKNCNGETKFKNLNIGFREFCSVVCSSKYNSKNENIKEKRKRTNNLKYGGHPSKNNIIKEKIKITKNLLKLNSNYQKNINEKRKRTTLQKYGVEYTSQTQQYKNTLNKNLKEKYSKITNNNIISKLDNDYYLMICKDCNKEVKIHRHLIKNRTKNNILVCTNCKKKNTYSIPQLEIMEFINNNYNGIILYNKYFDFQLDIYLPELKLAIEFNGLYWHSEKYRDKEYHLNKTEKCLEKDIHLIHIYEDDWNIKKNIVKSRLLNLLGKSERIYARKCIIKEINNKDSRIFLNENHIQGVINSSYNYGLYYQDELVSLMTFGKNRFDKNKDIELLRFCNKLNKTIIGGASKLFKYALSINEWDRVLSYADRSWSKGNLYENLKFEFKGYTPPNYFYVINGIRENRFKYRKSELIKLGFDKNLTEHQIMLNRGLYRIYNSGNLKYEWNKK